jgi:hypothetical protein
MSRAEGSSALSSVADHSVPVSSKVFADPPPRSPELCSPFVIVPPACPWFALEFTSCGMGHDVAFVQAYGTGV